MQSSDNAFNRVKSLLGKLDRSIDDARRRRLTDDDDPPQNGGHGAEKSQSEPVQNLTQRAQPPSQTPAGPQPAPRSNSKYGRARPIRELPGSSAASWQTA